MVASQGRSRGRVVLTVLFALVALNAGLQVLLAQLGRSDAPETLVLWQGASAIAAVAAAWGSWSGARWAPGAALGYGVVAGAMLAALPMLLGLEPSARGGVWAGSALLLLFGVGAARHLRRALRVTGDDVPGRQRA